MHRHVFIVAGMAFVVGAENHCRHHEHKSAHINQRRDIVALSSESFLDLAIELPSVTPTLTPSSVADSLSFSQSLFTSTPLVSVPSSYLQTSSAPLVSSTTASTVQNVSSFTSGVPSSGKKGLCYNEPSLTEAFANTGMTWAYNWGASSGGSIVSGAEYVPMLWGASEASGWSSAVQAAISSGSSHVLSFNEPDMSTQSNISAQVAAQLHIANMGDLGSVQVGSPAITNGNSQSPPMGILWLQQFFSACGGQCKVDFVAFHYYADTNLQTLQDHVNDVISTAQANGINQVWLTEWSASGSDDEVAQFITDASAWLNQQASVGRYTYFMCNETILLSGSSLSTLGQAYAAS